MTIMEKKEKASYRQKPYLPREWLPGHLDTMGAVLCLAGPF